MIPNPALVPSEGNSELITVEGSGMNPYAVTKKQRIGQNNSELILLSLLLSNPKL
jgi:hypothetical protein